MTYSWHYYDVVLFAIAASIVSGVVVGLATPIALIVAVTLFCFVAIAIIGHALFVNGPVDTFEDVTEEVQPEDIPVVSKAAQLVE